MCIRIKKPQIFTQLMDAMRRRRLDAPFPATAGLLFVLRLMASFAVTFSTVTAASSRENNISNINYYNVNKTNVNVNNTLAEYEDLLKLAGKSQQVQKLIVWDTASLIRQAGFPLESHNAIFTADGYVLGLQRLRHAGHQPVLLVHGLFGSSLDFVALGGNISLAFQLWTAGFDVWLGDCRGLNGHIQHSSDEVIFWNFSFHQIGVYDLPAMIDYVRVNTSFHEVHLLAHSQGGTALLVMLTERPEYQQKVGLVQLLAPLVHFQHAHLSAETVNLIRAFLKDESSRNMRAFLPRGTFIELGCERNQFMQQLCLQIIGQFTGKFSADNEKPIQRQYYHRLRRFFNNFPAGGSVKQLRHFFQLYSAGSDGVDGFFRQYDYGREGNFDFYGTPMPSIYHLSRIEMALVIHHSEADILVTPDDIALLMRRLSKSTRNRTHLFSHSSVFNHLEFLWGNEEGVLRLNREIVKIFKTSEKYM